MIESARSLFANEREGCSKKADDLSKLCGVEVAVLIVSDSKAQHFATSDVDRIITRFQALNSGQTLSEETEKDGLYKKIESQRREMEALQRQLVEERKKVEALVGGELHMLQVHPNPPAVVHGATPVVSVPLPAGSAAQSIPTLCQPVLLPQGLPSPDAVIVEPLMPLDSTPAAVLPVAQDASVSAAPSEVAEPAAKRAKVET